MKYALAIYGAPATSQAAQTALHFAKALINKGHSIHRLFFYQDGVHTATTLASPPQDEQNLPADWAAFIGEHQLDSVVCIAAALRRGVIDASEAERYERPAHNLTDPHQLSGLGQLIDAGLEADRLVTFGS
ncbi:sulfurtransferase [Endozoicomonas montiporae]|uniref:Sulfurtransferase n=2 Tax=Endozoicomonas montiporae TaxID=1027273 RepID=A0A081NAX8_9GAMM|nr:sulfurtransferase complex subunit TusD [Endozoicomonas montiporae]AMO56698.1 sulfur transfer complex subunit TusD [Endozoicomonas montiporae CL-33]KEQ15601.1 sulfurtransferase [Endozoicomonas montiporae]